MAVLHYEDGYSQEYITNGIPKRLYGIKREGKRPILIELNQKEWDNKDFRWLWAEKAKHATRGKVVLNKDVV